MPRCSIRYPTKSSDSDTLQVKFFYSCKTNRLVLYNWLSNLDYLDHAPLVSLSHHSCVHHSYWDNFEMKQIIEYLPIIIFTITYFYTRDIFFATLILLIGLFIQVCLEYLLEKKVSKKTKIIFGISLLFGGSTLFFRNEEFLFWDQL